MPHIESTLALIALGPHAFTVARVLVALAALANFGGLVADDLVPATAQQHMHNPRWPPHAKFHNGQTICMGICLGVISLALLFAPGLVGALRIWLAAATAGTYFVAMLAARLFPGTAWHDPEFLQLDPMPLGQSTQKLIALVLCAVLVLACALAALA